MTSHQLAAVLERAANYRTDVKKARVRVDADDSRILLVDVDFYTAGRRVQRDAAAEKVIGSGRTVRAILDDWLGQAPDEHRLRDSETLKAERQRHLDQTPEQLHESLQQRRRKPAPTPPPSRFQWPAGENRPSEDPRYADPPKSTPEGQLPQGPPDPHPPMTRQQMLDAGMDSAQRADQYRKQGGKHPDDA